MGRNGDLRSQSLDLLRFPLAVVVLIIHVFTSTGVKIQGETMGTDAYPVFLEVNRFIDAFLRGQSVPIYYFISGFVFFLGVEMTKETYLRKFKNRLHSLVIPYFVWNALSILLLIVTICSPFSRFLAQKSVFTPSLSGFLSSFWVYDGSLAGNSIDHMCPIDTPLWFVRDLIIVVLCTPLLHYVIKHTRYYFVLLLGVFWFVRPFLFPFLMEFDTAFFFFSWGAYMSINRKDMLVVFGRYFRVSVWLYILLGLGYVASVHYFPDATYIIKRVNVLVGLLFAYNLAAWLLQRNICRVNPFLASASFFIYVAHNLICFKILKLLLAVLQPVSDGGVLALYILATIVCVGLLLGVFYLMKRYTPGLLKVVAGRK